MEDVATRFVRPRWAAWLARARQEERRVETGLTRTDIERMRGQLFFDGPERGRRLSRYWLLLLSAVIASAGARI